MHHMLSVTYKNSYTQSVTCVSYFFKEKKKGSRIDECNTYIISSFLKYYFLTYKAQNVARCVGNQWMCKSHSVPQKLRTVFLWIWHTEHFEQPKKKCSLFLLQLINFGKIFWSVTTNSSVRMREEGGSKCTMCVYLQHLLNIGTKTDIYKISPLSIYSFKELHFCVMLHQHNTPSILLPTKRQLSA